MVEIQNGAFFAKNVPKLNYVEHLKFNNFWSDQDKSIL